MTTSVRLLIDRPVSRTTPPAARSGARHALAGLGVPALARSAALLVAGALPVSAIPVYVLGWLPMTYAAAFVVVPAALVAAVIMLGRSSEGIWAGRGFAAGLLAVLAYDSVRMPLVWTNVWPDFIPRLGGWVVGGSGTNTLVGYTWRYLGDGGGMGLSFFVFCGALLRVRPKLIATRPVLASIGYGVFVWAGLMATVALPARGEQLLFRLTPASVSLSLLGHLIYGAVLGLCLRRHLPIGAVGVTGIEPVTARV